MMLEKTSSILAKINQEAGKIMKNNKYTFWAVAAVTGAVLAAFKIIHFLKGNNCKISVVCWKCDKAEDLSCEDVKAEN